ncbi:methyltransferase domain-containing protein [Nitratireductor sp. XY-223]|uniref:class I SAM-dependent methyltransferase n=1 Tax=Nitratireductor sp. XY-223 TaxID=2561926 RepID=UPI0010AACAD9|nr:methyltransferase domain-containing protein [Nitratireductor sp. XY-223]
MKHDLTTGSFPLVSALQDGLNKTLFGSSASAVEGLHTDYGDAYLADFENSLGLLQRAFPDKDFPTWAVRGFQRLGSTILREEVAFKQTGQYSASVEELQALKDDFYSNPEVMEGYYLVGLYCTYFLWPHHYRLLKFYREAFLSPPHDPQGLVMEWGPGHGLLSVEALGRWADSPSLLIDLSPQSLQFSEAVLGASGAGERVETRLEDVLAVPSLPQASRIVCGELLEHVPDPKALVGRIKESLQPGGLAFLTGAINAPQPDHIFLFRSEDELLRLVEEGGLDVHAHLTVRHPSRADDENPPEVTAMVVGHGV